MTWLRDRVFQISGVLCLLGQGTLLLLGSVGQRVPDLALPGVFLLLTLILAVALPLGARRQSDTALRRGNLESFLGKTILVLAVSGLLAAGLGVMSADAGRSAAESGTRSARNSHLLAEVRQTLADLPTAGEVVLAKMRTRAATAPSSLSGGELFQFLETWPEQWPQIFPAATSFPLELVVWQAGQPVAWTMGAEPLDSPAEPDQRGPELVLSFQEQMGTWYLRCVAPLDPGRLVEMQFSLAGPREQQIWPGVRLQVSPVDQAPILVNDQGDAEPSLALADSDGNLAVMPTMIQEDPALRQDRLRSRFMLMGGVAWLLALAGTWRLFWGWPGMLAGLWLGRGVLAAVDFFRWSGPAFPGLEDPAPPSHLISLVGPAYFATPFAAGWFASTADALLTAGLVSLSIWALLRFMGVIGPQQGEPRHFRWLTLPGQGPVSGLVFGLVSAGVLLGLRGFAGLVTDNANPRLIGQGASLTFLSFWGLHFVLMLISFSLTALLAGWAAGRPWPPRRKLGSWLAGAAITGLVGVVVFQLVGDPWPGLPALAGLLGAGFWLMAPGFRSRPRFLRRFAWPAVLLLTVVWNYTALRQVYDQAERGWLERKGQRITGSGEDWTRFLLEDAMLGMKEQDAVNPVSDSPTGIWRDEPAFALWQASALGDLGYSCLVEIIDAEGREESLFTTGFMGDYQYEVVSRSPWTDRQAEPANQDSDLIFQTERRRYPGGEEEILAAEIEREAGDGWIRVELPTRSWRISTLMSDLTGGLSPTGGYQPRSEVDRPVLLLRGDDSGWLDTGDPGFDGPAAAELVEDLKAGRRQWAVIRQGEESWLCLWSSLPTEASRTPGEGFLLGLRQSGPVDNLLDLSRLMLLNLALLFLLFLLLQTWYRVSAPGRGDSGSDEDSRPRWLPGFQEKFLTGYLLLGLLLLLVVGMSVDRVGYDRVRAEARSQTREGLNQAVAQLRGLMVEQARSLAGSEYIADLLLGQLVGQRPAGPLNLRQGMVFGADGELILDETLSNLSPAESDNLLQAGRKFPLLVIRDDGQVFVATVIPIDLGDVLAAVEPDTLLDDPGHGQTATGGFFLYRQQLDQDLLRSLADLVQGQATLRLDGQPILASHPGPVFSGQAAMLANPGMMASLLDHPGGPGVFAHQGRPFAFVGGQPLPAFGRDAFGQLERHTLPAVLTLGFPDREREYAGQRRGTVLFLAGLANLILLTALLLALLMSWNLFRPLRLLLTATRSLARGDFKAPLPDMGSDEVGRLTEAFGRMRNELHSARERLAARERFLTTVLDQVTVGVAVLDESGQVAALNPAGGSILADFHPQLERDEGVRRLLADFRELGGGNPRWGGELRGTDGLHTLRGAMAPLELADGRTDVMLVFEDITEFLQTKKMAINAELARQVAHEIKNPLTPIQLSVQLLSQAWQDRHPQLDKIVTDTVSRVLDQVELLRTIASEFSLLGRPGILELAPFDLVEVANQVVDAYRVGTEGTRNGFKVEVAPAELPKVLGDDDSLRKILGNLMQNSLDAARPETPLEVAVTWEVTPVAVTLIWTDNGQGLPPEVADRLFDPYFSTKSKGTGLGLAICRNLADRMGGSITLASRTGAPGARATLTLPRVSTRDNEETQP